MINLERKGLNQQKPLFSIGLEFSQYAWQKCIKLENKWKRKGIKVLIGLRGQKPLKKFEENDKNNDWKPWPTKEREKSVLKKFESDCTREKQFLKKTLYTIFDWSKVRFDRSKVPSIDLEPIEQQSNWSDSNQNFNHIFDWSKNIFDRSKIWKT